VEKELKILLIAILTMLFYGLYLVIDNKPFFIYPLNVIVNAIMTFAIVITLKKYDWRNLLVVFSAIIILFQDALFMSFFTSSIDYESKNYQMASFFIIVSNTVCFIALLEKNIIRNILVIGALLLSILSFIIFGLYGMFLTTTLGLLLVITSKNSKVEFLKVYWMFFIFMMLNKVISLNIY
jgi:hypothetical protein